MKISLYNELIRVLYSIVEYKTKPDKNILFHLPENTTFYYQTEEIKEIRKKLKKLRNAIMHDKKNLYLGDIDLISFNDLLNISTELTIVVADILNDPDNDFKVFPSNLNFILRDDKSSANFQGYYLSEIVLPKKIIWNSLKNKSLKE